jgi:hypothetical protein
MTNSPDPNIPPHPLDPALRQYFRRQVPDPFPPCRPLDGGPRPVPKSRRAERTGVSGRAVLAVAAAVLLGIGILLSSGFPATKATTQPGDPGVLKNATADGKELLPPHKKPNPMGDSDLPLH